MGIFKNGSEIRDGDRASAGQGIPRDEAQSTSQTLQEKRSSAQTREICAGFGPRSRWIRALRKALPGIVEGVKGQALSQVREEASRRPHSWQAEARGDARRSPGTEEGSQRQNRLTTTRTATRTRTTTRTTKTTTAKKKRNRPD